MQIPLEPNQYYHIYNRANGKENLFSNDANYFFFLSKYSHYLNPIIDTYAYCLMPNHFHLLVKIKSEEELNVFFTAKLSKGLKPLESSLERLISLQFGHFFNSYTQSYNKQQQRNGSLFFPNFKRKIIDDENYLEKVIHYIHHNPLKHGYCKALENWKFSSYNGILSDNNTLLKREEVISIFDNRQNFIYCHKNPPELTGIN